MFKFLRKYNKYILAVGGTLLLITFLIPTAITGLAQRSAQRGQGLEQLQLLLNLGQIGGGDLLLTVRTDLRPRGPSLPGHWQQTLKRNWDQEGDHQQRPADRENVFVVLAEKLEHDWGVEASTPLFSREPQASAWSYR